MTHSAQNTRTDGTLAALICLVVLWVVPSPATALPGHLNGFVDLTTIQSDLDDERRDTLRRESVMTWAHTPTPRLMIQTGLRYFRYDIEADLEGDDWRKEFITHGNLSLRPSDFTFSAGARRREAESRSTDGDLITDNVDLMFSTTPTSWPILSVRYGWQHIHDEVSSDGRDTYDRSFRAGLDWNRSWGTASYGFTRRNNENVVSGLDSRITDHVLRLGWFHRPAAGDPLYLNANYTLSHSRQTDTRSGVAAVLESVPYLEGLYALDGSPEVGELDPVAGLDDGDMESATSPEIDLGGAVEDRNLGVDFGFRRLSDTIYLSVDRVPGDAVLWSVWVSEDNNVWELWDAAPLSNYNAGLGRFEIRYLESEHRYVKLVKSGLASTTSLYATELAVFRTLPDEFEGQSRERTIHMATARAGYRLAPGWRAQADASRREELAADDYDDRSATDYSLKLMHDISARIDHEISWEQSFQDRTVEGGDLRGDYLRYGLHARPYDELRGTFSAGRRWSWIDGVRDQIFTSTNLDVRGQPTRVIAVIASGGWSRTNQSIAERRFTTVRARLGVEGKLRTNLDLGVGAGRQRTVTDPLDDVRVRQTWDLNLTWRITPSLLLRGATYLSRDDLDTETSNVLLDWRLTPKLSTGVQATRSRSGRNSDTDRLSAHLNYRFNGRGLAYLRYSEVDFQEAGGSHTAIFQQGLRVSF